MMPVLKFCKQCKHFKEIESDYLVKISESHLNNSYARFASFCTLEDKYDYRMWILLRVFEAHEEIRCQDNIKPEKEYGYWLQYRSNVPEECPYTLEMIIESQAEGNTHQCL